MNSILYFVIQFVSFYFPYILTIKIFWFDKKVVHIQQSKYSEIDRYSIVIQQQRTESSLS